MIYFLKYRSEAGGRVHLYGHDEQRCIKNVVAGSERNDGDYMLSNCG